MELGILSIDEDFHHILPLFMKKFYPSVSSSDASSCTNAPFGFSNILTPAGEPPGRYTRVFTTSCELEKLTKHIFNHRYVYLKCGRTLSMGPFKNTSQSKTTDGKYVEYNYLRGAKTLDEYIKTCTSSIVKDFIFSKVVSMVQELHGVGLTQGRITPENIIVGVDTSGTCDFGIFIRFLCWSGSSNDNITAKNKKKRTQYGPKTMLQDYLQLAALLKFFNPSRFKKIRELLKWTTFRNGKYIIREEEKLDIKLDFLIHLLI